MLLEKKYEANEDGTIKEVMIFKGEELARKSDVYEWYIKSRAYTDSVELTGKVAIWLSLISMIISAITFFMSVFI